LKEKVDFIENPPEPSFHEPTEVEKSENKSTVEEKKSSRFSLSKRTPLGRNLEDALQEVKTEMKEYFDEIITKMEEE